MKKILYFLMILSASNVFAIDKVEGESKSGSCAIRLSNSEITEEVPVLSTEFCSGMLTENGTMIVLAAHCLNQVFEDVTDDFGNTAFHMAFPGKTESERISLKKGQYSVYAGDQMKTASARKEYITGGESKFIQDDIAIIKLAKPLSGAKTGCPVLPDASSCKEFEEKVNTFGKGAGVQVDFFVSKGASKESGQLNKMSAVYPSARIVQVQASDLMFAPMQKESKNLESPVQAKFSKNEKAVNMRKGDSGSVAYWAHGDKTFIVGTQSAISADTATKGYFAQICKQVVTKSFQDFVGSSSATADKAISASSSEKLAPAVK